MANMTPAEAVDKARAVIFDLFHTLTSVDSVTSWTTSTYDILGVTEEAWLEQVFDKSRDRLTGKVRDPLEMIRGMAHAIDPGIPDDRIRAAALNRARRFENALRHVPGATRDVLVRLKMRGKMLGLISNADAMEIADWDVSPVAGLFDCTVFSCDVGVAKPDREVYEICLNELGATPGEAVYVGDGGSDELKGARAMGMTTVMMTGVIKELWPERIAPRLPNADFVIERLDELLAA